MNGYLIEFDDTVVDENGNYHTFSEFVEERGGGQPESDPLKLNKDVVAPDWNETSVYQKGSYVMYFGDMYRCLVNNTGTLPTTESTWEKVKIGSELNQLNENIADLINGEYSTDGLTFGTVSDVYGGYIKVGKLVIYNFSFKTTSIINSSNKYLVQGMPKPAIQRLNCVGASIDGGQTPSIFMGGTGNIVCWAGQINNNSNMALQGIYLAQS